MHINPQKDQHYQLPPKEILDLADVKPRPQIITDDKAKYLIIAERNSMYKSLQELSEKEFRLGSLRINPANYGVSRAVYQNSLKIERTGTGEIRPVIQIPQEAMLGGFSYSPDQTNLAFFNNTGSDLQLWVLDVEKEFARKLDGIRLNEVTGRSIVWYGNDALIVKTVCTENHSIIQEEPIPEGPVIQESVGTKAPNRTYQDLLKNKTDEANFDAFSSVNLEIVYLDGSKSRILKDQRILDYSISPDRKYILVESIEQPYSYLVPYYRFPIEINVFDLSGKKIATIAKLPLAEDIPIAFDAVRKGVREIEWRSDKPSTLVWAEALDEGDPAVKVPYRDALYSLEAPFSDTKKPLLRLHNRISELIWGDDQTAFVKDYWWKTRNTKTYCIHPGIDNVDPIVLFDKNTEDVYADPGSFVEIRNSEGKNVLYFSNDHNNVYLIGEGCSPQGNRPFLDNYSLKTGKITRIWRADGELTYERIYKLIDVDKGILLTSIESKTDYPNFFLRNFISKKSPKNITGFNNPYQSFEGIFKEKIFYKRSDGIDLSATLYLPAGYNRSSGKKLPMILWAYPREFKNADAAGQITNSPNAFPYLSYGTPVYWAAKGYAILDEADFPIIGEGTKEPNDTYISQLISNAQAAIDAVNLLGYIDTSRVGIGGHSYGAFMAANLLTHSSFFACGVARSGAYNRTLTPFGFQSEERTFWQAPEVYNQMSPFHHVGKMKTPLLLIHGLSDNNPGTFTLQSERYFQALKGQGAVARLVLLPFESHGYAARSSIMHVLWEQNQWFEKYLMKN